jgi:SET domain-containing protein
VFALERIPKNKRIIHYAGEKISSRESLEREERYLRGGRIWCFRLNSRWVIDGSVGGNLARYINHSCTPNCYAQVVDGVIWIRASKTIAAGDELTYNYQTDGSKTIACRCRPNCRTRL